MCCFLWGSLFGGKELSSSQKAVGMYLVITCILLYSAHISLLVRQEQLPELSIHLLMKTLNPLNWPHVGWYYVYIQRSTYPWIPNWKAKFIFMGSRNFHQKHWVWPFPVSQQQNCVQNEQQQQKTINPSDQCLLSLIFQNKKKVEVGQLTNDTYHLQKTKKNFWRSVAATALGYNWQVRATNMAHETPPRNPRAFEYTPWSVETWPQRKQITL